ncbi:hypothetical protein NDU88_001819 [Pleurodeles waltl]|uniref:Uncharacterized protein n=1 Tax=Pleurodeles waltl TaxID=8319 RepID=A0AAV7P931_PLEWA|nr:hypothetical protein NDU88_001819 [Pleurodeles waltl]
MRVQQGQKAADEALGTGTTVTPQILRERCLLGTSPQRRRAVCTQSCVKAMEKGRTSRDREGSGGTREYTKRSADPSGAGCAEPGRTRVLTEGGRRHSAVLSSLPRLFSAPLQQNHMVHKLKATAK